MILVSQHYKPSVEERHKTFYKITREEHVLTTLRLLDIDSLKTAVRNDAKQGG